MTEWVGILDYSTFDDEVIEAVAVQDVTDHGYRILELAEEDRVANSKALSMVMKGYVFEYVGIAGTPEVDGPPLQTIISIQGGGQAWTSVRVPSSYIRSEGTHD